MFGMNCDKTNKIGEMKQKLIGVSNSNPPRQPHRTPLRTTPRLGTDAPGMGSARDFLGLNRSGHLYK